MSMGVKWTGWDGSEWDLRSGPVRLSAAGISGLLSLKFDSYTRDSAARDGQRFQGWRAQPRSVLLPVFTMRQKTEAAWLGMDRAWWRTMQPGRVGTLTVTTPDGGARKLDLRFEDDGNHVYAGDPSIQRVNSYALNMIADDPYWYSDTPWGRTFSNAGTGVRFLGGGSLTGAATKGPPFVLAPTFTTDTSVLTNPGDVNSWPVYTLTGPLTSFSITVDGGTLAGTLPIAAWQKVVIDTSPTAQTVYLYNADGSYANKIREMTSFGFRPIPPGVDLPLNVNLSGTGTLTVTGTPRYFKAW